MKKRKAIYSWFEVCYSMSKSTQWDKGAKAWCTVSGVWSLVQRSSSHIFSFMCSLILLLLWDFLTSSLHQFLSPPPSQGAPFLYFHPFISSFHCFFHNCKVKICITRIFYAIYMFCSLFSYLTTGVLFLMNCHLTIVCFLPSNASLSSPFWE